jgi:hypothetical protein
MGRNAGRVFARVRQAVMAMDMATLNLLLAVFLLANLLVAL